MIPAFIGVGLTFTAFFINKDIDGDSRVIDINFSKRLYFNLKIIKNGFKLKQLW